MVLEGGIKGWVKAGPTYTGLMDGYREEYWQKLFAEEAESSTQASEPRQAGEGDVKQ